MKFETAQIYLLSEVHPEILPPWQRDVTTSPLYRPFPCSKRPRFQSEVKRKNIHAKMSFAFTKEQRQRLRPLLPSFS